MLNVERAVGSSPSAQDFVTFNRVVNIMDLGTAAGDCASAFQSAFGSDTAAATAAWDFRDSVKFQIVLNDAGVITEADVVRKSSQEWDTIHVYFLTKAEDAFFKVLAASKARTSPELSEAIGVFRKKIEAGRRLEIALV